MHKITEDNNDFISIKISGKIEKDEYKKILQHLESKLKKFEEIDLLVDFTDLDKMTIGSIWEDLKFDIKNFRVIRKFAIVGNSNFQKMIAPLSQAFVTEEAKFFNDTQIDEAKKWIH